MDCISSLGRWSKVRFRPGLSWKRSEKQFEAISSKQSNATESIPKRDHKWKYTTFCFMFLYLLLYAPYLAFPVPLRFLILQKQIKRSVWLLFQTLLKRIFYIALLRISVCCCGAFRTELHKMWLALSNKSSLIVLFVWNISTFYREFINFFIV